MRFRGARRALVATLAVTAVGAGLAACAPEPPAPAPLLPTTTAPAPPTTTTTTTTTLPAAPLGATVAPLDPMDAPDPFVLEVAPEHCVPSEPPTTATTTTTAAPVTTAPATCYVAYTTQVPIPPYGWILVPIWRSTDLASWHLVDEVGGTALATLAPWVEPGYNWAPSVLHRPDNPTESRYVMWYTARQRATGRQCLGVATAPTPLGPFVDTSETPAYCQSSLGGTIDASPFVDDDGAAYLVYKSESPAKIWISTLRADGLSLVPDTERFLWERSIAAGDHPYVEGPTMVRADGRLYLFYSTDAWWTSSYRVGVATCAAVSGPCAPMYSTAVLGSRGTMLGPGGQTPFRDAAGTWLLLFHAWTAPTVGYPAGARSLHLLPLTFTGSTVLVG